MGSTYKLLKKSIILLFFLNSILSWSQTTATYDFTFTSIWNATDHTSIPSGAHWSNLVGATHKNANEFVQLGINATTGIQNVAETGTNTQFNNEVNAAITANNAEQWFQQGFSPFAAISSATLSDVEVTEEHHFLTLISMIAPSPDWFVAVNSLDLRTASNDGWKTSFTLDVFAYDAGTDNGVDYSSANSANTPVGVSMISGFPINGNKMGTLSVTLKSVLSVDEFNSIKNIKVFPNPTKGVITISNANKHNIESVEIYDVFGKLVLKKLINNENNRSVLNLSSLQSGIYIAKLSSANGLKNITKKIVVN